MELEQRILQNLVDAGSTRTIFAVTHRLSLADIADRVLVLKDGKLVHMMQRHDIEGRDPQAIAQSLIKIFEEHCEKPLG